MRPFAAYYPWTDSNTLSQNVTFCRLPTLKLAQAPSPRMRLFAAYLPLNWLNHPLPECDSKGNTVHTRTSVIKKQLLANGILQTISNVSVPLHTLDVQTVASTLHATSIRVDSWNLINGKSEKRSKFAPVDGNAIRHIQHRAWRLLSVLLSVLVAKREFTQYRESVEFQGSDHHLTSKVNQHWPANCYLWKFYKIMKLGEVLSKQLIIFCVYLLVMLTGMHFLTFLFSVVLRISSFSYSYYLRLYGRTWN